MRINDPRHGHAAAQVDPLGCGTGGRKQLVVAANTHHPSILDRHRLGPWLRRYAGVDATGVDQQVDGCRRGGWQQGWQAPQSRSAQSYA
ncbi:MAG: hypothetical protein ACO203_07795 [Steroidobacteraceae bacterium]